MIIETNTLSIYTQVARIIEDDILSGKWKEDDRILSVRDFASLYEVNPNTVMRAFDILSNDQIIYNKRGMGYFVSPQAYNNILKKRKQVFMTKTLKEVSRQMSLLKIEVNEVVEQLNKYKNE